MRLTLKKLNKFDQLNDTSYVRLIEMIVDALPGMNIGISTGEMLNFMGLMKPVDTWARVHLKS